jgi:hypothetical protein
VLPDIQMPLMSRPTSSALTGKNTCTVKTQVPDEVLEELQRFTKARGYGSVSDCMREILLVTLYGPDYLASLHAERIRSLVRNEAGTRPDEVQP